MTPDNLLGQSIGDYTIDTIVGSGGMAVVYRASHPHHGQVALKVLFPPPSMGDEVLARFEREARTAASLKHPAIIPVLEAGQLEGRAFIAMPLIEGQTLSAYLGQT
ncbi:MAG: protein kinase, partial [Chloroflexota bacterium]